LQRRGRVFQLDDGASPALISSLPRSASSFCLRIVPASRPAAVRTVVAGALPEVTILRACAMGDL